MKIMLAVNGSKYSKWAVELMLGLPFKAGHCLSLYHAIDLPTQRVPLVPDLAVRKEYIKQLREKRLAEAGKLMGTFERRLKERFGPVGLETAEANVAEGIIKRSAKEGVDLVVVGSRGLSNISAFLLGGVSQRVLTYSPCSVMVVKKMVRSPKRLLLAVDGSKYSDASVDFLKSAFTGRGVEVTVLGVWDLPVDPPGRMEFMERYCGELEGAGFGAVPVCVSGNPAEAIIEEARARRAALVVMGSKGVSALNMFLLGRTARKVATYGDTSVLLVRGV